MLKQSVCAPIIKPVSVPYRDFIPQIAQIGYHAIEFWQFPEDIEEISDLCSQNQIAISSFTGHESITNGMNSRHQHTRIIDELSIAMEKAHRYQIGGIICFSGSRNPDQPRAVAIENCVQCLKGLAPLAEKLNVNLNLELLNSQVDHPNYDCDHTDWGVEVVEQVDSPKVKLLFDIYHMQIMEGNIIASLTNHIDKIGHIHTAGVPGRSDFDDTQELNYTGICKTLSNLGYAHYIGHEFQPNRHYRQSLQLAFDICNQ